jgi:YcxB-like protein
MTTAQPITTLNYQLDANDYLCAARTASPNQLLLVICLMIGIFTTSKLLQAMHIWQNMHRAASSPEYNEAAIWFNFLISTIVLLSDLPKANPLRFWSIPRLWKRSPQMQQPINLSISETGINFQIQGFQDFKQWQYYKHFRETKNMFLLYYSESLYYILPKRAFSGQEQMSQFRDVLSQNNVKAQQKK